MCIYDKQSRDSNSLIVQVSLIPTHCSSIVNSSIGHQHPDHIHSISPLVSILVFAIVLSTATNTKTLCCRTHGPGWRFLRPRQSGKSACHTRWYSKIQNNCMKWSLSNFIASHHPIPTHFSRNLVYWRSLYLLLKKATTSKSTTTAFIRRYEIFDYYLGV